MASSVVNVSAKVSVKVVSIIPPNLCKLEVRITGLKYDEVYDDPEIGWKWTNGAYKFYEPWNSFVEDGKGNGVMGYVKKPTSSLTYITSRVYQSDVFGKTFKIYATLIPENNQLGSLETYIGPVTITYSLPSVPSSISYSSSINSYSSTSIRWGTSTVEGGGSITYVLERSKNGGTFSQIYNGSATSYSDSGLSSADSSVRYRVKAVCNAVSSDYKTGSVSSIYYNVSPGVPTSLTVPTTIKGGQAIAISWGTASDSNLSGYMLQRAVNGGAFTQVYKGANRSYTDTAQTSWNTVQYRVNAYDTYNSTSGYRTGNVINVIQNTAPVISGTNTNLGLKTGAFNQAYTVTDADAGQTITVVEKLDSKQKRSFTATSGTQYSFAITAAEWLEILNGTHTLTITATDNYNFTATRTYTFSKNMTEIEFKLATPLAADALVTRAIMSVTREIPSGAKFTVEVCNNGNDVTPTWEDVTNAVLSGSKFFLSNTTKTAANWGFNFRIKVQRNSAIGDCYIQGVGGNFE